MYDFECRYIKKPGFVKEAWFCDDCLNRMNTFLTNPKNQKNLNSFIEKLKVHMLRALLRKLIKKNCIPVLTKNELGSRPWGQINDPNM